MLDKLRKITEIMINKNKNSKELKKYILIQKILNDNNCFLKIDIETAYSILRDLNFEEEELNNIYKELINVKED